MRIHRRFAGVLAGVAGLALAVAGCSSNGTDSGSTDGSTQSAGAATEVEVFTWWTSGGEKAGLDGLVSVLAEKYPDVEFINGAVAGGAGSAAKDLLQSRLQANGWCHSVVARVLVGRGVVGAQGVDGGGSGGDRAGVEGGVVDPGDRGAPRPVCVGGLS